MAGPPKFAPTPIRLFPTANFTGGLNLRADAFQLAENESPDMLDVTVEIGGGFVQRQVVAPYAVALANNVNNFWAYTTPTVTQTVAHEGTELQYSTGGAWTNIVAFSPTTKARATTFNNVLYVVGGAVAPIAWNGSAARTMTQTYNETIGGEGAADGNMPMAQLICSHVGRVFIGYTTESGTDFPTRIRWSHAGFAEDWRQEDYIDVDLGRSGDVITAMVEFRDRLYIFKNHSISILTGYSTSNFALTTISQDIGAVSQEAVCLTDVGLFNFSWPQGVYLDRGTGPYPIFDKLYPLIRDGFIPSANRSQIAMGWVNQYLWCSVPYNGSTTNTRTLVYNPWIYKNRYLRFLQGPWYPYSLGISNFVRLMPAAGNTLYLASKANDKYIGQLEQNGSTDNWGAGAVNISSYFKTRWEDLGSPSVIKRWRHPDIAMRNVGTASVPVEVRKDYNPSAIYKTFQIGSNQETLGMQWQPSSGAPANLSFTVFGPGDTSTYYTYAITAIVSGVETAIFAQGTSPLAANSTLDATHYVTPNWGLVTAPAGATSFNVYGRKLGNLRLLANVPNTQTTYSDQGGALGSQVPPATPPLVTPGWDDGSGTSGGGLWSDLPVSSEIIARGGSMGSARAVQLTFNAPTGQFWGVDAISYKYIPKRVRG